LLGPETAASLTKQFGTTAGALQQVGLQGETQLLLPTATAAAQTGLEAAKTRNQQLLATTQTNLNIAKAQEDTRNASCITAWTGRRPVGNEALWCWNGDGRSTSVCMIKSTIGDSTTVAAWLSSLEKSQKDAFVHYAKNATSDIEAYLYARFLNPGYAGSISDITAWVQEKYPKEDLRKVLLREIDDLQLDIRNVRDMTQNQMLDHATAATKISTLQKELRSHIQAVRAISDGLDRRGLLLAGADRCLRELVQTFDGQPGVQALLEDSSIIVWTTLEKEEKS
jgi:hypothetical protein